MAEGNSDRTDDCLRCWLHNTKKKKGRNKGRCSAMEREEFLRCSQCRSCNCFEPIDKEKFEEIKKSSKTDPESKKFPLERVALTRWKWKK